MDLCKLIVTERATKTFRYYAQSIIYILLLSLSQQFDFKYRIFPKTSAPKTESTIIKKSYNSLK